MSFGIPRNYRHIWDTLQGLSVLQGRVPHLNEDFLYLHWTFVGGGWGQPRLLGTLDTVRIPYVYNVLIRV